jgi:hypothetical protein
MKRNLLTKGILITVMSLALASMTACSNNNSEVEEPTEEELPTVSATVEPSTPPVQKEDDVVATESTSSDKDANDKNSDKTDTKTDSSNIETEKEEETTIVKGNTTTYTDHLNTVEYIVNKDGKYDFTCKPSDNKAYWDVYVLDEPFEDALRYLTSAYSPKLKANGSVQSLQLKKGQYVYGVCSENSFTDEGTADNFKCPLTIELD